MKRLLYLFLILISIAAKAQETYSISGKVTDAKGETLPGATVFLTNSRLVTTVNGAGTFNLDGLQPGTYELVVKLIGYTPHTQNITIQKQSVNVSIKLGDNATALNEVVIKAKTDPNRARYLKLFIKNFIGESENASSCKILNPDIIKLHYDKDKDILEAHSDDFIVIENQALGYKINYLLLHFELDEEKDIFSYEGKPYFEDIKDNGNHKDQWDENRKTAYNGSIRHFFRALFNNTAEAEGFVVYRLPIKTTQVRSAQSTLGRTSLGKRGRSIRHDLLAAPPINSNSLVSLVDNDFRMIQLSQPDKPVDADSSMLFVVYTREDEQRAFYGSDGHIELPVKQSIQKSQVSHIEPIKDGMLLDRKGNLTPANAIIFNGYWTWERVADLMPFDYAAVEPKAVSGKFLELTSSLDSFRNKAPVEKVHMHFDKPYYSLGDTVWMKAYVVNATNELSTISKLLYIDLINDKDSIKTSMRLPLTHGLGWSALTLSDSLLQAGNYHIRAYTSVMRNFGEEYFFDKAIKIGNALPPKATPLVALSKSKPASSNTAVQTAPIKDNPDNINVQFFPEGGDLVNDLISKVAFKAIGHDGLSREISGFVVDKNNQHVTPFQTDHAGMGAFSLQPVQGNSYTAVIKLADGSEKRVELPKAKDKGYNLTVRENEENVTVTIQASNALLNTGEISLIAQSNNTIFYTGKKELTRASFTATIPKSRFPEGILQFTLFAPDYKPVAERLVFIRNNNKHLNIKLVPDKKEYKQRNHVNLNVEVTDQNGNPVTGAFSLAVTDESKVPIAEANEKTIFSNLLLTADLKGYIEHPNYYFTDINTDKDRQLDNLLLTQGWRRFVWGDLLNKTYPTLAFQAEKGRGISGRVLTSKGKPEPGAKVSLLVNFDNGVILDTTANEEGRFAFDFPFAGGTTYNVSATNAKKSTDLKVEFDKQQNPQPVTLKNRPLDLPETSDFNTFIDNSRKRFDEMKKYGILNGSGIMLKEVKINAAKKAEDIKAVALQHSSNLAGPGNADQVFTFVDLLSANSGKLGLWLTGRMPGIHITIDPQTGDWAPYSAMAYGADGTALPMTLIVDGIERESSYYSLINVDDISSIEILRGSGAAALYGLHGAAGVFIITTKKGDVDYNAYTMEHYRPGSTKPPGLKKQTFEGGYDLRKQFYSPNYDNPATQTQIADLRTTIYWNPTIITDEKGKATIKYFNADGTGKYRVVIEGLDTQGKLGRQVYEYVVK